MTDKPVDSGPILVPIDFSSHAEAALVWASRASRAFSAPLVALHVVHDPAEAPGYYRRSTSSGSAGDDAEPPLERIEVAAREMMDDFLAGVASRHPELGAAERLDRELVVGVPVTRILEVAGHLGAQLIVMGSQGRTGLKHVMLGSKAEQVVRLSTTPVTIVKN